MKELMMSIDEIKSVIPFDKIDEILRLLVQFGECDYEWDEKKEILTLRRDGRWAKIWSDKEIEGCDFIDVLVWDTDDDESEIKVCSTLKEVDDFLFGWEFMGLH